MKRKKKNTKLVLLILLICITLGYAALRTGLNINGTTNISSASWNVHFENYQMSNATNITPTTEPSISGTTTTSISYEVDLEEPGDLYEFTVEVVNGGSLDALISLVSKYNDDEIDSNNPVPSYITYSITDENGDAIEDGHQLDGGDTETIKVYVKYRDDDPSILPNANATLTFELELEGEQAPKEVPVSTSYYVYSVENGVLGLPISENYTTYNTAEEVMAANNNIPVFLKHKLSNGSYWCLSSEESEYSCINFYDNEEACLADRNSNFQDHYCLEKNESGIVIENYVGFKITDAMAALNPNVTPGIYYIRQVGTSHSELYEPVEANNYSVAMSAFGSEPFEVGDLSITSTYYYIDVYYGNLDNCFGGGEGIDVSCNFS